METIEKHRYSGEGYKPLLIREGWQVAQLNFTEEQKIDALKKLDVHHHTDEVFMLMKGTAVLIGGVIRDGKVSFQAERMEPNITYNIPQGTWHNIAMKESSEVLIIEKSNTHVDDYEFYWLNDEMIMEMKKMVEQELRNDGSAG